MKTEIEGKFKLNEITREQLIAKLTLLGAEYLSEVFEQNWLFDRDDELRTRSEVLRLRVVDRQKCGILTHKKPLANTQYKARTEIECHSDSNENLRRILTALNYATVFYYEKKRRKWHYKNCEIVIDTLPQLGDFTEIEADNSAILDEMINKLSLPATENLSVSYLTIWREYCAKNNLVFSEWKF